MDTDQILSVSSIVIVCGSCIGCVFYAFYVSKRRELQPEVRYEPMINLV